MWNKYIKNLDKYKYLILALIVFFACIRLSYLFSLRTTYHIDEMFSYGYANSYFDPYLYTSSVVIRGQNADNLENFGIWITGDVFKDYLTVDEEHRFAFDSVIYNKIYDDSPSLYELLLHFICSFFPGVFSLNFAFSINLVLYVCTCFLIFRISEKLCSSVLGGFFSLTYLILSGACTSNYLYLRVYPLYTTLMLCMVFCFLFLFEENENKANELFFHLALLISSLLGYFTHYFFILYAFVFTFSACMFLFFTKKHKRMFSIGFTMLVSVLVFFVIFPFSYMHIIAILTGEDYFESGYKFPYFWDLSIANKHFFLDTIGFYLDFSYSNIVLFLGVVVFCTCIIGLLLFLFRNETFCMKLRAWFMKVFKRFLLHIASVIRSQKALLWIMLITSVSMIFIIPAVASLFNMGYIDRYFFPAMQMFMIFYSVIVFGLISCNKLGSFGKRTIASLIICAALCLVSLFCTYSFSRMFVFDDMDSVGLRNTLCGKDCYIVTEAPRDLTWLSGVLYESEDVYISLVRDTSSNDYLFPDIASDSIVMITSSGYTHEDDMYIDDNGSLIIEGNDYMFGYSEISFEDFIAKMNEAYSGEFEFIKSVDTFVGTYYIYSYRDR